MYKLELEGRHGYEEFEIANAWDFARTKEPGAAEEGAMNANGCRIAAPGSVLACRFFHSNPREPAAMAQGQSRSVGGERRQPAEMDSGTTGRTSDDGSLELVIIMWPL